MMPSYVALTTLTDRIRMDELASVAAALQTQVTRDFSPHWCATAVIVAAPFEAIQAGYCPVIVQDTLEVGGACGLHRTEADEAPYIVLPYGPSWSLAASHAVLQMLADPTGASRRSGASHMAGQGTVDYLIDVCAPCQDIASAYTIGGVVVSDFCTPDFFAGAAPGGASRSFTGSAREPLRPAANGLLTWLADDRLLYQARADETGRVAFCGGFSMAHRGQLTVRELVDMLTPDRLERLANARPTPAILAAQQNARRARFANTARYRDEIAWRFGHANRPLCEHAPDFGASGHEDEIAAAYAGRTARSGHQFVNGEVRTTARTAS